MTLKTILALLLAVYVIGMGVWVLAFRPDTPATAQTATRKSRQLIAIGAIVIGVLSIAVQFYPFPSE